MLAGLGFTPGALTIARLYRGVIDTLVLDREDAAAAPAIERLGIRPVVADTLMTSPARARRLAGTVLRALDGAAP
jgi:hypothetical protein